MPDKLTDSVIVKALKEILEIMLTMGDLQKASTISNSIDLINRLQADVENYKQVAEHQQKLNLDKSFEIKRLKEEYPFKCKVGNNSEIHSKSIEDYDRLIADIQAEAYKECIKKVKDIAIQYGPELDNLLKELMGEDDVKK